MKNVFVLLVDGLRGDCLVGNRDPRFLERYGQADALATDHLDAAIARGARFRRAYTSATEPLPALATLLTGCQPPRHGVRCPCHGRAAPVAPIWAAFAGAGYRTVFANPPEGASALGLTAGLEVDFAGSDRELFEDLERETGRPHLVVASFQDVTTPYLHTNEPQDPRDLEAFVTALRAIAARYAIEFQFEEAVLSDPDRMVEVWEAVYAGLFGKGLGHPVENLVPLYVRGIRKFDEGRFRAFWSLLEASPLSRGAVVVVTSLFGEAVYRPPGSPCDLFHHGWPPVDGAVRVPLGIAGPGVPPGTAVEGPVSLVDVAPTLADLAGLGPLPGVQGTSLVEAAAGGPGPARPCYSEHSAVALQGTFREFVERALETGQLPEHRCLVVRRDLRLGRHVYVETGEQLRKEDLALPDREFVHVLYTKLLGRWPREAEHAALLGRLGSTGRRGLVQYVLRQARLENRYRLHDVVDDPDERVNLLALDETRYLPLAAHLQGDLVRISLDLPPGAPIDDLMKID